MDGPMRPYLPELTIRDYNIYQWYLRGVQYQLNTTYGLYSCSLLQHNGVLFALLSDSLAGREATCKKVRLPWTLCWRQKSTCLRSFQAVFPPTRMTMMTRTRNPQKKQKPARRKCCNTHGKRSAM